MRKTKIGYKVICEYSSNTTNFLGSVFAPGLVKYNLKKRNYKRLCDGGLALFSDLRSARKWARALGQTIHIVWKCKYRPSKNKELFQVVNTRLMADCFIPMIKRANKKCVPENTVYADWVEFIKQIY